MCIFKHCSKLKMAPLGLLVVINKTGIQVVVSWRGTGEQKMNFTFEGSLVQKGLNYFCDSLEIACQMLKLVFGLILRNNVNNMGTAKNTIELND